MLNAHLAGTCGGGEVGGDVAAGVVLALGGALLRVHGHRTHRKVLHTHEIT